VVRDASRCSPTGGLQVQWPRTGRVGVKIRERFCRRSPKAAPAKHLARLHRPRISTRTRSWATHECPTKPAAWRSVRCGRAPIDMAVWDRRWGHRSRPPSRWFSHLLAERHGMTRGSERSFPSMRPAAIYYPRQRNLSMLRAGCAATPAAAPCREAEDRLPRPDR